MTLNYNYYVNEFIFHCFELDDFSFEHVDKLLSFVNGLDLGEPNAAEQASVLLDRNQLISSVDDVVNVLLGMVGVLPAMDVFGDQNLSSRFQPFLQIQITE